MNSITLQFLDPFYHTFPLHISIPIPDIPEPSFSSHRDESAKIRAYRRQSGTDIAYGRIRQPSTHYNTTPNEKHKEYPTPDPDNLFFRSVRHILQITDLSDKHHLFSVHFSRRAHILL